MGRVAKKTRHGKRPDICELAGKIAHDPEALELFARLMEKLAERSPHRPR